MASLFPADVAGEIQQNQKPFSPLQKTKMILKSFKFEKRSICVSREFSIIIHQYFGCIMWQFISRKKSKKGESIDVLGWRKVKACDNS